MQMAVRLRDLVHVRSETFYDDIGNSPIQLNYRPIKKLWGL